MIAKFRWGPPAEAQTVDLAAANVVEPDDYAGRRGSMWITCTRYGRLWIASARSADGASTLYTGRGSDAQHALDVLYAELCGEQRAIGTAIGND